MIKFKEIQYGNNPFVEEEIDLDEKLKSLFSHWLEHEKAELTAAEYINFTRNKDRVINMFMSDMKNTLYELVEV